MHARRFLIAAGAGLVLCACDAQPGDARGEDRLASHTIDPVTGERSMVIEAEDGRATLRTGPNLPLALPPGFSLFPDARIVTNAVVTRPGGEGAMVSFEVDAPGADVLAHYRREAEAAGFAIAIELDTERTRTLAGQRPRDRGTFSLTVTDGTPTAAQLTIVTGEAG